MVIPSCPTIRSLYVHQFLSVRDKEVSRHANRRLVVTFILLRYSNSCLLRPRCFHLELNSSALCALTSLHNKATICHLVHFIFNCPLRLYSIDDSFFLLLHILCHLLLSRIEYHMLDNSHHLLTIDFKICNAGRRVFEIRVLYTLRLKLPRYDVSGKCNNNYVNTSYCVVLKY